MKIKRKSIIIPAFALLIGASLAGSITGTLAWYQYSTRTNAAYVGMSGGKNGNLQMRFDDNEDWTTRITFTETATYLGDIGTEMAPVTPGAALANNEALPQTMKAHPVYGKGPYTSWLDANEKMYVSFPLQLRFIELEGDIKTPIDGKKIYLSELYIEPHAGETDDITNAIRVHISNDDANTYSLISKLGEEISVGGSLDLDGDDLPDKAYPENDKYGFAGGELLPVTYGTNNATQVAYSVDDVCPTLNDDGSFNENDDAYLVLGTTASGVLNLTVTIWVEGWQELDNSELWSKDYINSQFDIGFEFAVNPEE